MDNQRVVVYAGTRNVYPQMYTSLKSLLLNTPVDFVYLLIEDDEFPYVIPEYVHPCNVTEQQFFKPGSPNYGCTWSYMEMLRACLGDMLPEMIERVLWLDIDTIIDGDISELFEIDMAGYYYAGVYEPKKCTLLFRYINTGVVVCNLELLRQNGKEHEIVDFLNRYKFDFPCQDVINLLCQGRIKTLDSEFNCSDWTQPCIRPKVIHYAAVPRDKYIHDWAYRKYEQIDIVRPEGNDDGHP